MTKTPTPAEIRQLIADLRQEHLISARDWSEEDASKISTAASRGADALEYLLQFVEWKPTDTAPTNTMVLLYYPNRGVTNGERIELGFYRTEHHLSANVDPWATYWRELPPPPEKKKDDQ